MIAVLAGLAGVASMLFAGLWQRMPLPIMSLFMLCVGGLAFAVFATRVELRSWWGLLLVEICIAGASVLVLEGNFLQYTALTMRAMGLSLCLAALIQLAVFALIGSLKIFALFWLTFCLLFDFLDTAVYQFSGNLIALSDVYSVATAMNVAGNHYTLQLVPSMVFTVALYICVVAAVVRIRVDRTQLRGARPRVIALCTAAVFAILPGYAFVRLTPRMWGLKPVSVDGAFMSLVLQARMYRIDPPEGYSQAQVARLDEDYPAVDASAADAKRPHVIAIMIEAFSDLSVLGDYETDVEVLPYMRELERSSVHGKALVSTLGGGTARSEWEFLTGNTMGFMPSSCSPFKQYVKEGAHSIVQVFRNSGYHTIGMHPNQANGWGRNVVYPILGFDEIYFVDDLEWDGYERGMVSDIAFVHQIIRLFEEHDDAPLFLFGVTMQNHGSYEFPDFAPQVHLKGLKGQHADVEQYLSLTHMTDAALRELIEYFSACDEPVEIVFFGDHQPKLNNGFYNEIGLQNEMSKYLVPFVLWDNYAHRTGEIPYTSLNFLAAQLIERTGIRTPSWYRYLLALEEDIPAMDHVGYVVDGEFRFYESGMPEQLKEYRIYQYANLFDDEADGTMFVGAPASGSAARNGQKPAHAG